MTTISVPLSAESMEYITRKVKDGEAANKADVVRQALKQMRENDAVQAILRAEKEPTLRGNLRDLVKKI